MAEPDHAGPTQRGGCVPECTPACPAASVLALRPVSFSSRQAASAAAIAASLIATLPTGLPPELEVPAASDWHRHGKRGLKQMGAQVGDALRRLVDAWGSIHHTPTYSIYPQ